MNDSYTEFLASKRSMASATGIEVAASDLNPMLFPFQRDLVRWSLRKGRCALLADTGLGKTPMQLEWARLLGMPVLILAPLSVTRQTVREGEKFGVKVTYARCQAEAGPITITNYEMVEHFDPAMFPGVVLDESSCLKSYEAKTRTRLIELFRHTPYRLCCTATPAPNDIAEIANHAEFLGIMTRADMLAQFFVHDDEGWRLKGHAREPFFRWLASWGMSIKRPSDLGYSDEGYVLPPLFVVPEIVDAEIHAGDRLFFGGLKGIGDRAQIRKQTMSARIERAVSLVRAEPDEPWIVWCGLNEEGKRVAQAIPEAILVEGSDSPDAKAQAFEKFVTGEARVIVTKARMGGYGSNWQHCARMVFLGLSDSFEDYYQLLRRCWRFGQQRAVTAYVVLSDAEQAIFNNVRRKEQDACMMSDALVRNIREFMRAEISEVTGRAAYEPATSLRLPDWLGVNH